MEGYFQKHSNRNATQMHKVPKQFETAFQSSIIYSNISQLTNKTVQSILQCENTLSAYGTSYWGDRRMKNGSTKQTAKRESLNVTVLILYKNLRQDDVIAKNMLSSRFSFDFFPSLGQLALAVYLFFSH